MRSSQGTKMLQSFSPSWGNPELLEKTLTGRRRELVDRLEKDARNDAGGPNKHQHLLVGVRGSGKTHMLRVLHNRLFVDEVIKKRLLIISLLENELGVASFTDFVVRLLRTVCRWYPQSKNLPAELGQLYALPHQAQQTKAVQLLLEAAGTRDILIITENLGQTFGKKMGFGRKGQQALRDLVQQHSRIMIFASAQTLISEVREHDAPFFGFFKITHLSRLRLEESSRFLLATASAHGLHDQYSFMSTPEGRGRVETICAFTDGNHRLLVNSLAFLRAPPPAKLSEAFMQGLNPLLPYYQERMRSLSAQQQKIVQFLSLERVPRSVTEISRHSLTASNVLSSQLKYLLERNFVSRIPMGRESYYEIAEVLFRICHEADLGKAGTPTRLFVDFLSDLYTAKELQPEKEGGLSPLAERPDNATKHALEGGVNVEFSIHGFHEYCMDIFEHGPPVSFASFITSALKDIHGSGFIERFEESLALTVIAIVNKHAAMSEGRMEGILETLEGAVGAYMDVSVGTGLLRVGIDHFKRGDKKALLRLTKEERQMFLKEVEKNEAFADARDAEPEEARAGWGERLLPGGLAGKGRHAQGSTVAPSGVNNRL